MTEILRLRLSVDEILRNKLEFDYQLASEIVATCEIELHSELSQRLFRFDLISKQRHVDPHVLVYSFDIHRSYGADEILDAEAFRLSNLYYWTNSISSWKTQYSYDRSCKFCDFGRVQVSPIIIPMQRLIGDDAFRLGTGEIIVTASFLKTIKGSLADSKCAVLPVFSRIRGSNKWLNDKGQFCDKEEMEHVSRSETLDMFGLELKGLHNMRFTKRELAIDEFSHFQLLGNEETLSISSKSAVGEAPFQPATPASAYCPFGHVAGDRVLSELYVQKVYGEVPAIALSSERFGAKRGYLSPFQECIVRGEVGRELLRSKLRGMELERVWLV